MEGELWAARMASKRQHLIHASQAILDRHLSLDDLEGDDDVRPLFSCPYCYEEYDIASLCSHVEDEHSYDPRGVICPVCNAKIGRDIVSHITIQHAHLFKIQRRRRFRRSGGSSHSTLSFLGKELSQAHLQALLSGCPRSTSGTASNSDNLLSSFVYSLPIPEPEEAPKPASTTSDNISKRVPVNSQPKTSTEPSLSAEERERKVTQATLRAKFVQQLVLSSIWPED